MWPRVCVGVGGKRKVDGLGEGTLDVLMMSGTFEHPGIYENRSKIYETLAKISEIL